MAEKEKSGGIRRGWKTIWGMVILLIVWQMAAGSGIWSAYVLPPPAKVARALTKLVESGVLFCHILVSGRRVLTGFSIAFALAMAGGILATQVHTAEEYYGGLLEFMRNVHTLIM